MAPVGCLRPWWKLICEKKQELKISSLPAFKLLAPDFSWTRQQLSWQTLAEFTRQKKFGRFWTIGL